MNVNSRDPAPVLSRGRSRAGNSPWNNGKEVPRWVLLRYRKWVPQQLGDVNKQGSGDSRPIGARHSDTAANHMDLQSGCGHPWVFAVRVWLNLWDLIVLRTSLYSMGTGHCWQLARCWGQSLHITALLLSHENIATQAPSFIVGSGKWKLYVCIYI